MPREALAVLAALAGVPGDGGAGGFGGSDDTSGVSGANAHGDGGAGGNAGAGGAGGAGGNGGNSTATGYGVLLSNSGGSNQFGNTGTITITGTATGGAGGNGGDAAPGAFEGYGWKRGGWRDRDALLLRATAARAATAAVEETGEMAGAGAMP